jgi:hypothetical protein
MEELHGNSEPTGHLCEALDSVAGPTEVGTTGFRYSLVRQAIERPSIVGN